MGSTSSKAAKTAAGAASRQYPTRIPSNPPPSTGTYTSPITSAPGQAAQANQSSASSSPPTDPPAPQASTARDATIDRDASDPHFAASLRSLGPVTPSSTMSNSSTFSGHSSPSSSSSSSSTSGTNNNPPPAANKHHTSPIFPNQSQNPALLILQARERIAAEAEKEFAVSRTGKEEQGRRYLDVGTIREALVLRDRNGLEAEEIERTLGFKSGVMGMLGRVGEARVGRVDGGDSGIY